MILLIDNYDSFVFNLARYFERLGQPTEVVRNDATTAGAVARMKPAAVVISPGPCTPAEAGCSIEVVRQLAYRVPILGVCLGHQAIAAAFGGQIIRAREPMHGRTSQVRHDGKGLFEGVNNPLTVCRYHSLVADPDSLPECLRATAWAADGTIMALAHRAFPVLGVQFHPESILTYRGYDLLVNFLRIAGISVDQSPSFASELVAPPVATATLPERPVTF